MTHKFNASLTGLIVFLGDFHSYVSEVCAGKKYLDNLYLAVWQNSLQPLITKKEFEKRMAKLITMNIDPTSGPELLKVCEALQIAPHDYVITEDVYRLWTTQKRSPGAFAPMGVINIDLELDVIRRIIQLGDHNSVMRRTFDLIERFVGRLGTSEVKFWKYN